MEHTDRKYVIVNDMDALPPWIGEGRYDTSLDAARAAVSGSEKAVAPWSIGYVYGNSPWYAVPDDEQVAAFEAVQAELAAQ